MASQLRFSDEDEGMGMGRRGFTPQRNPLDAIFSCGDKKQFRSKKHANRFLNANDLDRMHAYYCDACNKYHVGHS